MGNKIKTQLPLDLGQDFWVPWGGKLEQGGFSGGPTSKKVVPAGALMLQEASPRHPTIATEIKTQLYLDFASYFDGLCVSPHVQNVPNIFEMF